MSEFTEKKISSRDLNPRQRRKLGHIVRWYRSREAYNHVTSIRFELIDFSGMIWIHLRTRRSDCGQYSPRAILCERTLHALIGPRGGVKVSRAEWGIGNSEKTHVQHFI